MEKIGARPAQLIRNPDVLLREEDVDGALLFNPDTNQFGVLNATGLFIWKLCDGRHDLRDIVAAAKASFDAAPEDEIADQVGAYVDEMVAAGFIGRV